MSESGKGIGFANWLVSRTSGFLDARLSRRSFVSRATLVGTAVAASGCAVVTRPGAPYTRIVDCPSGALCRDGYTEFCCVINQGVNACPPNTIPAGWWRADFSVFCNGRRFYIDCNEVCCGPVRGDGFCAGCHACECAAGCATRKVHCNYFRYGQCNQAVAHIGPIACRVVTCVPPYTLNIGCTASGAVDNATANHNANCAAYVPPPPPVPPMAAILPGLGGATVPVAGEPVVFARHTDASVRYRRFSGGSWAAWSNVGGSATSGGSAGSPAPGEIIMAVRLADNALWWQHFNGSTWSGLASLGGSLISDPVAVVHDDGFYVFARVGDTAIAYRRFASGAWGPWVELWGMGSSTPAAASSGGTLFVAARLADFAVWAARKTASGWVPPLSLGGSVASDPSVAALGTNLYVFARWSDATLRYRVFDEVAQQWNAGWVNLGGPVSSDPTVVKVGSELVAVARNADVGMSCRRFDGSTWTPWTSIGGDLISSDMATAVDGNTLHVFAARKGVTVLHCSYTGGVWTPCEDLGGTLALVRGR
jgi:hypothetical protein